MRGIATVASFRRMNSGFFQSQSKVDQAWFLVTNCNQRDLFNVGLVVCSPFWWSMLVWTEDRDLGLGIHSTTQLLFALGQVATCLWPHLPLENEKPELDHDSLNTVTNYHNIINH